jgi:hypothetical protein
MAFMNAAFGVRFFAADFFAGARLADDFLALLDFLAPPEDFLALAPFFAAPFLADDFFFAVAIDDLSLVGDRSAVLSAS